MGSFDLDLAFAEQAATVPTDLISRVNKISAKSIVAESITVDELSAISSNLGTVTAGSISGVTITGVTISGGTILGTTFKTGTSGERVEIDAVNGIRIYDAGDVLIATLKGTLTFAAGAIDGAALTDTTVVAGKLSVSDLSAISANLGSITAGSIDAVDITGGTITGTTFETAGSGSNRVTIDSTNGLLLIDSGNVTRLQLNAAVYAGLLLNGIRSIDTNDVFMESQNQSVQLFLSQSTARVSFVAGSATRAYVDNNDGNGAGNQPTSLVIRVNGSLQRVNYQAVGGYLYI